MDISGPIRSTLRRFAPTAPTPTTQPDPLSFYIHAAAYPDHSITQVPLFLAPGTFFPFKTTTDTPPVHQWFTLACVLRLLPRVSRNARDHWIDILTPQLQPLPQAAQLLLVSRTTHPVAFLWHYWLLTLAQRRLKIQPPETLLKGLWRRAFGSQSKTGQLHPQSPTSVATAAAPASSGSTSNAPSDTTVYDDLCALHAACNALIFSGQTDLLPPVESLLNHHVQHPQAALALPEPWALAAFAALDDTQTFAPQQLQNALARLDSFPPSTSPIPATSVILALLADALVTQEEAAAAT